MTTTKRKTSTTTRRDAKGRLPSVLVAFGLGANLGPAEAALRQAVDRLAETFPPLRVASLYETRPLGGLAQPLYLNTAAVGRSSLAPEEILAFVKGLERAAGRRPGPRHASRPLDIDLLLYGAEERDDALLTLPHPGLRQRWFVLAPLAEIGGDLEVPPDGTRVRDLLARCAADPQGREVGWTTPPLQPAVSSSGGRNGDVEGH